MKAWSLIRRDPHYRHEAFLSGLKASGYETHDSSPTFPVKRGDVLVIWNRYGHTEQIADRFEAGGGTVIVAENGYIQGRHDGGDYYALAIHGHNGSGRWHVGGPERWNALGVELKPWRTDGKYVLVAANRSFGMRGFAMPHGWGERTAEEIKREARMPVKLRTHPGNGRSTVPLEHDLRDAACVVIWSSSVGVKALIEGIPVACAAPWWICKSAAPESMCDAMLNQYMDERRLSAMHALAWAQWKVDEIGSGLAFKHLLKCDVEGIAVSRG